MRGPVAGSTSLQSRARKRASTSTEVASGCLRWQSGRWLQETDG